jgi:hypothetical protein
MAIEIRSYRSVFDLERRIYQVDRLRLNPGGVPLRGAVYCLVLLLLALLVAALPLLGAVARVLPWYVRDLAGPVGGAALLSAVRIDGRPFHQAVWALVSYAAGPRVVLGDRSSHGPRRRWRPGEMVVLPDGSEGRLRRLRCRGPAAVRVNVAHERVEWHQGGLLPGLAGHGRRRRVRVAVRELPGRRAPRRTHAIVLEEGARLSVLGAGVGTGTVVGPGSVPVARGEDG